MRLRPTLIEVSLERRDSMRISRSRLASCAACERRARRLHGFAAFFAFAFESGAARIERVERHQAAVEFGARARQRVLREADFARDFRGLFLEAFATQRGFLRTGALAFELAEQVGVFAMRALDAALRLRRARARPSPARRGRSASCASIVAGVLFAARELDAQLLDALLALEHAGVRIAAAIDAQPVAAYPLARSA